MLRRLPERFWKGLSLNSFTAFRIPAFNAANDGKVSFLSFAITAVAILPTEPSTLAFCFGFLTLAGMVATNRYAVIRSPVSGSV